MDATDNFSHPSEKSGNATLPVEDPAYLGRTRRAAAVLNLDPFDDLGAVQLEGRGDACVLIDESLDNLEAALAALSVRGFERENHGALGFVPLADDRAET